MLNVFHKLANCFRSSASRSARGPRRFAPRLEALHDRITPTVYVVGGHMIIYGTSINDTVSVAQEGSNYKVTEKTNGYLAKAKVTYIQGATVTGDITFTGYDGNDSFTNNTALRCFARGGNGNDTLYGGSSQDSLYGEAGNDYLDGRLGSDILYGGDGNDQIYAGRNDSSGNFLDGGNGDDHLSGGDGADDLFGSDGADSLWGQKGHDRLEGGAGKDMLFGGLGDDYMNGGVRDGQADYLHGGAGRDRFVYDPYNPDTDPWWPWSYNPTQDRDNPRDYNAAEDSIVY